MPEESKFAGMGSKDPFGASTPGQGDLFGGFDQTPKQVPVDDFIGGATPGVYKAIYLMHL